MKHIVDEVTLPHEDFVYLSENIDDIDCFIFVDEDDESQCMRFQVSYD